MDDGDPKDLEEWGGLKGLWPGSRNRSEAVRLLIRIVRHTSRYRLSRNGGDARPAGILSGLGESWPTRTPRDCVMTSFGELAALCDRVLPLGSRR